MKKALLISIFFLCSAALCLSNHAFQLGGEDLVLVGTGKRTMTIIGSVYTSSLYITSELKGGTEKDIIEADRPSAVIMNITSRLITRERFLKAVKKGFEKAKASGYHTDKDGEFISLFDSIEINKRDEIRLCYVPGEGLSTSIKFDESGETRNLGVIQGNEFKQSLYAIWLGPDPVQKKLKMGMLGLRK